ncbi:TPA: hypothetical protein OV564_002592, partial [Acinetobacter baumannii]|nr:hypothetical protein [Acinetobacter baumannii]
YLTVPNGFDVNKLNIEEIDKDYKVVKTFKTNIDLVTNSKLIAATDEILNQINKNGYAIHGATVLASE